MKLFYIITLLFLFQTLSTGQTVRVYSIKSNGQKGALLRTEQYKNNQLQQLSQFEEDGSGTLDFIVKHTYDDKNQLIKEVKTYKQGHEFDLITEYYYDSKGRKNGTLRGNNRTGQWNSERYSYNLKGDTDTVLYYQKNGDLTKIMVQDYEYDSQGRKSKLTRISIDTEMDEEIRRSTFYYEYDTDNVDEKIIEKGESGTVVYTEWRTNTTKQQPKSVKYQMLDFPTMKTVYIYTSSGKVSKKLEYEDDKLSSTTTFRYNSRGKIIEEKFKIASGYGGEIYVY